MSPADDTPPGDRIPVDWDVLRDAVTDGGAVASADEAPVAHPAPIPALNIVAASWADAVTAVAVCIVALVALDTAGHPVGVAVLGWAAALGATWWLAASTILVIVRQGTPGMLLAGIHFSTRVAAVRLPVVIVAAAASAALGGLPGALGARRSPLAVAAGSALVTAPAD